MKRNLVKIEYLTLGCFKNIVDTEKFLASLREKGFEVVPRGAGGDVILINTCGFIDPAKEESIDEILVALEEKKRGKYKFVVVIGCLVSLYRDELKRELKEVDFWAGVTESEIEELTSWLCEKFEGLKPGIREPRYLTLPSHISFLKVAEGCDRNCSFCVIPRIRGKMSSLGIEELVLEAEYLESRGVKELNLVSQDLLCYGRDRGVDIERLLEELLKRTRIPWIRLLYLNPEELKESLVELVKSEERILPYFDLAFQHISDRVLSLMKRGGAKKTRNAIELIRSKIPYAVLRGTVLVGFPGEQEEDFEELLNFIEEVKFDWLGVFRFYPQKYTEALGLDGQIPDDVAREREEEVSRLWMTQLAEKQKALFGKRLKLLIDARSLDGFDFEARSYRECYDIDGVVHISGDFRVGDFVLAEVEGSAGIDLIARVIKEERKINYGSLRG